MPHEEEELFQDPSIGLDPSCGFTALLALEVAELLDQFGQRLGHGLSPPARATTTVSPSGSMGGHDPPVKQPRRGGNRLRGVRAALRRPIGHHGAAPASRPPIRMTDLLRN